jgi:hypothetical protein
MNSEVVMKRLRLYWAGRPLWVRMAVHALLIVAILISIDWIGQSYEYQQRNDAEEDNRALFGGSIFLFLRAGSIHFWDFLERNDKPLLVVFTLGIVVFTYRLWSSTRDLVKGADEASERELRAYVSAVPCELPVFLADCPIRVKFLLTNHGKTPAHDFHISCRIALWPFPLPANWDFGDAYVAIPSAFVLFPEGQRVASYEPEKEVLSRDAARIILDNRILRVYIAGVVKYTDAFEAQHTTRFCASVNPNHELRQVFEGNEVKSGIQFDDCDQHNDAT